MTTPVDTVRAARIVGVSEYVLRRAAARGELKPIAPGNGRALLRFNPSEVSAWAERRRCSQCTRRAIRNGLCGVHATAIPAQARRYLHVGSDRIAYRRIGTAAVSGCTQYRRFVVVVSEGAGVIARPVVGHARLSVWEVALCECAEVDGGWSVRRPIVGMATHPDADAIVEYLRPRIGGRP